VTEGDVPEISPEEASKSGAGYVRDEDLPMLAAVWLAQGYDSDELRELAGLLTARGCRPTWTMPCRRACPRRCAGEVAVTNHKSMLQTGTTRSRQGVTGSGSPVMRPKHSPAQSCKRGRLQGV